MPLKSTCVLCHKKLGDGVTMQTEQTQKIMKASTVKVMMMMTWAISCHVAYGRQHHVRAHNIFKQKAQSHDSAFGSN